MRPDSSLYRFQRVLSGSFSDGFYWLAEPYRWRHQFPVEPVGPVQFSKLIYHQLVRLYEALCVLLICIMCKITLVSVLIILYLDYVVACLNYIL